MKGNQPMETRLQEVSKLTVVHKMKIDELITGLESIAELSNPDRIDFENELFTNLEKYVQSRIEANNLTTR